jgi:queuosine precursor transporter
MKINKLPYTFKCLQFFGAMYVTSLLLDALVVNKLANVHSMSMSVSTFIFPFSYFFGDIITEVYGYKISRQLVWTGLAAMAVFCILGALLSYTPAPPYWHLQKAYGEVLRPLPRVFIGDLIAMNVGTFVNIYAISKWKILTRGKYFWLRSLGSSAIGEGIFTILAFGIVLGAVMPFHQLLEAMFLSYIFKFFFIVVAVVPATFIVSFLKSKEGIDIYDYETNFSPFRIDVGEKRN